jgi:hypothetical protein
MKYFKCPQDVTDPLWQIILGIGDFHQVAPVIPGAGPSEILAASIKSSPLWSRFFSPHSHCSMALWQGQRTMQLVDAVGEGWDFPRVSVNMFKTTSSLEDAAEFLYPTDTLEDH